MAQAYYVPVARHCVVSPDRRDGYVPCMRYLPKFPLLESHWINHMDLWANWLKEGEIIVNGCVTPPDKPGLGVEMNEDIAKKAQISGNAVVRSGAIRI